MLLLVVAVSACAEGDAPDIDGIGTAITSEFTAAVESKPASDNKPVFASISTKLKHTCGVRTDGSVACWGWDKYGQSTAPSGKFFTVSAGAGLHLRA